MTPQTQKPEITKKSQKPGVSWATAGFLNRKPDVKKKPSDGSKREPDTAKQSKVESAVRGNQDKKSKKRAKQQQKTSLAPFGVTASRTELRNMVRGNITFSYTQTFLYCTRQALFELTCFLGVGLALRFQYQAGEGTSVDSSKYSLHIPSQQTVLPNACWVTDLDLKTQ